jgi:hypothetical protein
MTALVKRDVPRLFEGPSPEQRAAAGLLHIEELRELLAEQLDEEHDAAPDSPPGVTHQQQTD